MNRPNVFRLLNRNKEESFLDSPSFQNVNKLRMRSKGNEASLLDSFYEQKWEKVEEYKELEK